MSTSQTREEKISEFCLITGASKELAESLLTACNDSLEMAVNMHMEGALQDTPVAGPSSGNRKRDRQHLDDDDDDVRAPIPQKRETLVEPGYESYPARSNPHRETRVRSVNDSFRNFQNEARSYSAGYRQSKTKLSLEELFKPPTDLMFKGDWISARDAATAAKKWLIVNIQDSREFQCQVLNRDIWSNEAVKTIISEYFLFWQQYKEAEDAQRYMNFYPVNEWPHVAIIDPRTGERMETWTLIPDSKTFCGLAMNFLSLHNDFVGSAEKRDCLSKDENSIIDATEDEQIAAAIRASLTETKAEVEVIDISSDSESECEAFTTEDENSNMSEKLPVGNGATVTDTSKSDEDSKKPSPPSLSSENSQSCDSADLFDIVEDGSEKACIMIRFPDGRKVKRNIPSNNKFGVVTKYVIGEGFAIDTHEIVTNFPRRILTEMDSNLTLQQLGLFPRETIFVQRK